jgi:hypothetical protein
MVASGGQARLGVASKDVNTEAEEATAFGSSYQATTSEDTADWEDLVRSVVNCTARKLVTVL